MLPLCKFYRYLIYRLYHFREDTPVINTILILSLVHAYQILTAFVVFGAITPFDVQMNLSGYRPYLYSILFIVLNFLLFYNKKKWETYRVEFEKESSTRRKIGLVLVLFYLIGSIGTFFVAVLTLEQK
ncbi:MAG: hypothetical protein J6M59_03200 [Bacteroidaceae bacterium]|nr:hypothetical protein [Bacteroidaceae bacterium]